MKKIILDTNFLMIPLQFRVDIFSELERICHFNYELCIYEGSADELKNIMKAGSGRDKAAAKLALQLIRTKNIKTIKSDEKYIDLAILNDAGKDSIIATLDIPLKKRLLEKGASVVILRQKKYLKLVGKAL